MNGPGFFRASATLAAKDLRLEWRTLEALSASVVFSLIVLVIFNFAFGLATVRELGAARLVPGVIWIVLAFSAVVELARAFQLERRRDTLSAVFLAPIDRGAVFVGKFLASLIKITVLQWIVVGMAAVFFDFDLVAVALPMLLVLFVHALGLTELGTLFSAMAMRLDRGEALLATLLFPAAAPLFVSAVKCTASLLDGRGLAPVSHWMLLTVGFDVLYFLLALMAFEFVMED